MKFNLKFWSLGILHRLTFALVWAGAVIGPVLAAPDNQGKEFVLGFMENYDGGGTISFYLTGPTATTVTVQGGGYGPETFQVVPEEITPVTLPVSLRASGSGTIENKGLLLSAPEEFVVYGLNQKEFTTDAYLGLPTDVAGTEYIVPSFSNAKKTLPSELQIIAHQDGTEITFTPKKATVKGDHVKSIRAKKSVRFTLNRLESIQFKAKGGRPGDLTGSVITSSKPVSVFGGHQCGIVPNKALACDHLVEQIPPVNTWGNSFLTTPLASRTGGDIFRILAANDGTTVEVDGETVAELKRGQFEQVDLASGTFHHITTSAPALVVQYSKGQSVDEVVSDPFMLIIPPTEQFGSNYLISTPPEAPVAFDNYINIVAPTDNLAGLSLDGQSIAAPFIAIGDTGYSGAQVPVDIGTHTIRHISSNVPFGVYSYGFADFDSYGYPGGNRLARIAEPCTPTKTGQGDGLDNDCDRKIDEELFNELDDDGDGRIDEDLAPVESPVVNAGGPYTVNEGSSIALNGTADSDPNGDQLTFAWDLDNNGSFETAGAAPTFTAIDGPSVRTVVLRVTGLAGSSQATTTVTVNNVAPTVAGLTAREAQFCEANQLTVNFSDPALSNDVYSASVDWGDGSAAEPFSGVTSGMILDHAYEEPGTYTASVTVSDEDGGTSAPLNAVLIKNPAVEMVPGDGVDNDCDGRIDEERADNEDDDGDDLIDEDLTVIGSPTANAGGPYTVNEGSTIDLVGSGEDPNGSRLTFAWDLDGDGSYETEGPTPVFSGTADGPSTHTVTLRVTNARGLSATDSTTVTVDNVAPTIISLDAILDQSSSCTVNLTVNFSDPALSNDVYSANVDWGDDSAAETFSGITSGVVRNHAYGDPETDTTVLVTVSDENGGTSTQSSKHVSCIIN